MGNILMKDIKIKTVTFNLIVKRKSTNQYYFIFWNTIIFEAVWHSCCKKGLSSSDKSRSKAKVSLLMLLWLNLFLNKL